MAKQLKIKIIIIFKITKKKLDTHTHTHTNLHKTQKHACIATNCNLYLQMVKRLPRQTNTCRKSGRNLPQTKVRGR